MKIKWWYSNSEYFNCKSWYCYWTRIIEQKFAKSTINFAKLTAKYW